MSTGGGPTLAWWQGQKGPVSRDALGTRDGSPGQSRYWTAAAPAAQEPFKSSPLQCCQINFQPSGPLTSQCSFHYKIHDEAVLRSLPSLVTFSGTDLQPGTQREEVTTEIPDIPSDKDLDGEWEGGGRARRRQKKQPSDGRGAVSAGIRSFMLKYIQ